MRSAVEKMAYENEKNHRPTRMGHRKAQKSQTKFPEASNRLCVEPGVYLRNGSKQGSFSCASSMPHHISFQCTCGETPSSALPKKCGPLFRSSLQHRKLCASPIISCTGNRF